LDDRASIGPRLDPKRRDEWTGINFLLGEMDGLRSKGLIPDESARAIVEHYSARRDDLERAGRFAEAVTRARDLAVVSPREALLWSARAREIGPDRPEGWASGIALLRRAEEFHGGQNEMLEAEKMGERAIDAGEKPHDAENFGPVGAASAQFLGNKQIQQAAAAD